MKRSILLLAFFAAMFIQNETVQAQFFVDYSENIFEQANYNYGSYDKLRDFDINAGYGKKLSADDRFSNEYMLTFRQNKNVTNHNYICCWKCPEEIFNNDIQLGFSGRLLFNHDFNRVRQLAVSYGFVAGLAVTRNKPKLVYFEGERYAPTKWSFDPIRSFGILTRATYGKFYLQSSATYESIRLLEIDRLYKLPLLIDVSIGFKFANLKK